LTEAATTDIIADAAYYILRQPSATCTANNFIDEEVLRAEGITDFSAYSVIPGGDLQMICFYEQDLMFVNNSYCVPTAR